MGSVPVVVEAVAVDNPREILDKLSFRLFVFELVREIPFDASWSIGQFRERIFKDYIISPKLVDSGRAVAETICTRKVPSNINTDAEKMAFASLISKTIVKQVEIQRVKSKALNSSFYTVLKALVNATNQFLPGVGTVTSGTMDAVLTFVKKYYAIYWLTHADFIEYRITVIMFHFIKEVYGVVKDNEIDKKTCNNRFGEKLKEFLVSGRRHFQTGAEVNNELRSVKGTDLVFGERRLHIPATELTRPSKDMYVKRVHGDTPYMGELTDMDLVEVIVEGKLYLFYNGLGHDESVQDIVQSVQEKETAERPNGRSKMPRNDLFNQYFTRRFLQ